MVRPHSISRTIAALVLLAAAVAAMLVLGRWQLHRADERRAIAAAIEAGRTQPPLDLAPDVAAQELTAWRNVRASGQWQTDKTVLLENRNHEGRPGYWIATPLLLDPSTATAVLVLRGWMPRSLTGTSHPDAPAPSAMHQAVQGELALHVPRLYELGDGQYSKLPERLGAPGVATPAVQNLALDNYARASGLTMLPVVIQQLTPADDGLVHDWPQPSVDYNQNQGYALQWFSFAAIAGIAFLVVLVRAWRRRARAPI